MPPPCAVKRHLLSEAPDQMRRFNVDGVIVTQSVSRTPVEALEQRRSATRTANSLVLGARPFLVQ